MFRPFFPLVLHLFIFHIVVGQGVSTSVPLAEWGISDVQSIGRARFAIIHAKEGDRLEVRALYDASAFRTNFSPSDTHADITDFSGGFVNFLGGTYSTYGVSGGSASANHFVTSERMPALAVTYDRGEGGYCGMWMHLFNSAAPNAARRYFDSSPYNFLAVMIRGTSGDETVVLKAADEAWNKKEDSFLAGEIGRYTPRARVDTMWQRALVPLDRAFSGIDRTKLATLVFEAFSPSAGTFELGPISFLRDSTSLTVVPPPKPHMEQRAMQKALWVWETADLFDSRARNRLINLLKNEGIDNVFLALPYDSTMSTRESGMIVDRKTIGPIVQSLNASGVRVHALIGDKDFVLPDRRPFVRRSIEHITNYNESVPPGEQFYSIHLDVEPYLLPAFGSSRQTRIVEHYLETLAECARIAHNKGMLIGADIPFWFDGINEMTQMPFAASFNGATKPIAHHVIDMMDHIVLMDYRTSVGGENGIVRLAAQELEYADRTGKRIFVGLETSPLPDETILTFTQRPTGEIPRSFGGRRYMACLRKENRLVATLLSSEADIIDFLAAHKGEEKRLFFWNVERSTRVPGSASSFAKLGRSALDRAMSEATPHLRKHPSFLGFAIHYYRSYLKMGIWEE